MTRLAAWYWIRNNIGTLAAIGALVGGLIGGVWSAGRTIGTVTAPTRLAVVEQSMEGLSEKIRALATTETVDEVDSRVGNLAEKIEDLSTFNSPVTPEHLEEAIEPLAATVAKLHERIGSLNAALQLLQHAQREAVSRFDRLIGRQWYNLTSVRRGDQCYVNNTDYPLELAVSTDAQSRAQNFCQLDIYIEAELILQQIDNNPSYAKHCAAVASVPPQTRYYVNDDGFKSGRILMWWELRVGGETIDQIQDAQCR